MKPLALIPAREHSKRFPGKNRATIGGQTLVEIAYAHAGGAELPSILLTTDDQALIDWAIAQKVPGHIVKRPAHLASDETPMMDVVRHAMIYAGKFEIEYDAIVLLQPTSPLRRPADIVEAVQMLEAGADAVVSVVAEPYPEIYTVGHAGRMRQVAAPVGERFYRPNGAIFAIRREPFESGRDWWNATVVEALVMPATRSVDIDTPTDIEEVETYRANER